MQILPTIATLQKKFLSLGVFSIVFAIGCYVGIYFFTAPAVLSPAAGIGLAGLFILGIAYWPIIFIATYMVYVFVGAPILFTICFAIGQTVQAVVGVYLLKRFKFDSHFARLQDAVIFVPVAFIAAAIAPTFGYIGLLLTTDISATSNWGHWWTGAILSIIIGTPLIVRWFHWPQPRTLATVVETVVALGATIGISTLIFWSGINDVLGISLVYFLLIPLAWIALRVGPRFMMLALCCLSLIALGGTFARYTDTVMPLGVQLFETELFLIIISIIFLILVSLEEERKEINKQLTTYIEDLHEALEQLSEYDQAKNNFLAVLAHELRNPLATIVTYFELLKLQQPFSREGEESAKVIERRFQSIQRLLDDLLDVSRISQNKIELKMLIQDVRDAITVAAQNLLAATPQRTESLSMHMPDTPLLVSGDRTRLEQIFTNLLLNASKFTPEDGRIIVTAEQQHKDIVISVADTGIGISAEKIEKIFEVFYQNMDNTASSRSGLGIGLALTRDLVTMHQGTIRAVSDGLGCGSEFIVTLPAADTAATIQESVAPVDPLNTPRMHILIIDDNKSVADGIAKLLTLSGFTVSIANTGTEALARAAEEPKPDAIFLDIALPDMSGFDVARTLRNEHAFDGAIIAMSGYGQEEDKRHSREAGCTHHLTKPVRLAELLAALR